MAYKQALIDSTISGAFVMEYIIHYNDIWMKLSNAHRGRHAEAVPCYEGALGVRPRCAKALFRLGVALFALQRYPQAERAYCQAIQARAQRAY